MAEPEIIRGAYDNIWRTVEKDEATGMWAVKVHEDVSHVLEANKADLLANPKGLVDGDKDFRRVARIPLTICQRIAQETGIDLLGMAGQEIDVDMWNFLNKHYLNNGEYSALRTSEGRV